MNMSMNTIGSVLNGTISRSGNTTATSAGPEPKLAAINKPGNLAEADRIMSLLNIQSQATGLSVTKPNPPEVAMFKPINPVLTVGVNNNVALPDTARGRTIKASVYYPQNSFRASGPLPVVIFSPGLGGNHLVYRGTAETLASQGYIVIVPNHPGSNTKASISSALFPPKEGEDKVFSAEEALERAKDISFLLDSMEKIEKQVPEVAGRMDKDKIGMAGHSFGGTTTAILQGVGVQLGDQTLYHTDKRLKAFVTVAQPVRPDMPLNFADYGKLPQPAMFIHGEKDLTATNDIELHNLPFQSAMASGNKYNIDSKTADHNDFRGYKNYLVRGIDPTDIEDTVQAMTNNSILAFFEANLRNSSSAKDYLNNKLSDFNKQYQATTTVK